MTNEILEILRLSMMWIKDDTLKIIAPITFKLKEFLLSSGVFCDTSYVISNNHLFLLFNLNSEKFSQPVEIIRFGFLFVQNTEKFGEDNDIDLMPLSFDTQSKKFVMSVIGEKLTKENLNLLERVKKSTDELLETLDITPDEEEFE